MSDQPKVYRTWVIKRETIEKDDFLWLKAFDIPIRVDQPSHTFDVIGGGKHSIYSKTMFTCDTTTNKQRDMLVLKYGNDAVLIQEETVLPGTMSTCTLSDLTW